MMVYLTSRPDPMHSSSAYLKPRVRVLYNLITDRYEFWTGWRGSMLEPMRAQTFSEAVKNAVNTFGRIHG